MSSATSYLEQQSSTHELPTPPTNGLRESFNWLVVGCGAYLLLALVTYAPQDPGWSYVGPHDVVVQNVGGVFGAWCADFLIYLFGYLAFLIPSVMIWRGLIAICCNDDYLSKRLLSFSLHWIGFIITILSGTILAELYVYKIILPLPSGPGGVMGQFLTPLLLKTLLPLGSVLISATTFAIGITILTGLSWFKLIEWIGAWICTIIYWIFWPILILIPKKNKPTVITPIAPIENIEPEPILSSTTDSPPQVTDQVISKDNELSLQLMDQQLELSIDNDNSKYNSDSQ